MRGKQAIDPALALCALLLTQTHEGLLQRDSRTKVIAGALHVDHAIVIRFGLLITAVLHLQHRSADSCALKSDVGDIGVGVAGCNAHLCSHHACLQQRATLLCPGAVARGRVHDLMTEYGCKLRLAV